MPIALLPNVQLDQGQAEAIHLADQIEQGTVRDGAVAHLDERLVARHQRLQQLILIAKDRVVRGVERLRLAHDHSLEGLAGVVELIANLREHDAVGFLHGKGPPEVRVVALLAHLVHVFGGFPLVQQPGALSKRVGAPPHGQREDEVLDRLEVEVHGGDARQVHDVAGAGGGGRRGPSSRSPPIQLLNRMMECSMGILGRPWLMSAESMRLQNFGRPSNTVSLK